MYFDLNDEQRAFRDSLRAYFAEKLTPEVRAALGPRAGEHMGPAFRDFVKTMGHDGWLGVGWPVEYGGQGRGYVEELIYMDECRRAQAPIPLVTINTVGPTLMQFGSDEQKSRFLPAILRGEAFATLSRLSLASCGITDDGVRRLTISGSLGGLRSLSVAWNVFGDAGVKAIAA